MLSQRFVVSIRLVSKELADFLCLTRVVLLAEVFEIDRDLARKQLKFIGAAVETTSELTGGFVEVNLHVFMLEVTVDGSLVAGSHATIPTLYGQQVRSEDERMILFAVAERAVELEYIDLVELNLNGMMRTGEAALRVKVRELKHSSSKLDRLTEFGYS
jgi:hypothetical protein